MVRQLLTPLRKFINREYGARTIQINDVRLTVDYGDSGGRAYQGTRSFEELASPLFAQIRDTYNPSIVLDIGANYGFTGIVFGQRFPAAKLILVEPTERLCTYIEQNLTQNGVSNFEVIQAICAEVDDESRELSLHPHSSQDNRLAADNASWNTQPAKTITLQRLTENATEDDFIFIKVDTQGYEHQVFKGGEAFLASHSNWLARIEFAPYWLMKHETVPTEFLTYLLAHYNVAELPTRQRFSGDTLADIMANRIQASDIDHFVQFIEAKAIKNQGWCDLFVFPKNI